MRPQDKRPMSPAVVGGSESLLLLCKRLCGVGESIEYLRQKQLDLDFVGIHGQCRGRL